VVLICIDTVPTCSIIITHSLGLVSSSSVILYCLVWLPCVILSCSYLKRQLVIGKEARRVDILCHRIYLTYRLLEGTRRFKELHEIIEDAKDKLESEVGPLDGMSAKMARGIVSRSSVGIDVQKLCSIALQKVDEWLSSPDLHLQGNYP
jgi:hypothetical protein